jgi:hypothetical protein
MPPIAKLVKIIQQHLLSKHGSNNKNIEGIYNTLREHLAMELKLLCKHLFDREGFYTRTRKGLFTRFHSHGRFMGWVTTRTLLKKEQNV